MNKAQWKSFFLCCRSVLGMGLPFAQRSDSWCAWTTFNAVHLGVHYWYSGIPDYEDILDTHIADGGLWGQPFDYDDLAHVVIPATFYWETEGGPEFKNGTKVQNIRLLSECLTGEGIPHRITDLILEIKLY